MLLKAMAVLALVVGLSACRTQPSKPVLIDPALEALIPPDTTFATGANLDAIRTTHVFQKYLGQVNLPLLDEFTKKTGLDPRKDLNQILSCSNGKTALLFARGKFSATSKQIDGVNKFEYKGLTLFGNDQSAVLFLNGSTAVAGRTADLRTLVDSRKQGNHGLPAALRAKVETIGSNNQVWAAFTGGLQGLNLGVSGNSNLGQLLRVFRGLDSGTIGADLRDGIGLRAQLDCRTDNDAKHVHDAIRGVIGLGRLSTPDNQPELLKLYDAIKVAQEKTQVDVTAQVAADLEDKFLDLWLKNR